MVRVSSHAILDVPNKMARVRSLWFRVLVSCDVGRSGFLLRRRERHAAPSPCLGEDGPEENADAALRPVPPLASPRLRFLCRRRRYRPQALAPRRPGKPWEVVSGDTTQCMDQRLSPSFIMRVFKVGLDVVFFLFCSFNTLSMPLRCLKFELLGWKTVYLEYN